MQVLQMSIFFCIFAPLLKRILLKSSKTYVRRLLPNTQVSCGARGFPRAPVAYG